MLTDELKSDIRAAYQAFNSSAGDQSRPGQRHMLAWITKALMSSGQDNPKIVIEAGTGTGKTVGYLISALLCARELGKTVVVSTATISLQTQILRKDIPQLIECGSIKAQARLAKGRRRYLCPIRLDQAVADTQGQYQDEILFQPSTHQLGTLKGFYESFHDGSWNGDLDNWDDPIDSDLVPFVTTDHAGCRGRQCEAIDDCPFYAARDELEEAEIIVTNHDLVLSDLALGGGVVLPAPEDTIYVFDEAHHLGDKAINHQTASLQLGSTRRWLEGLPKSFKTLETVDELKSTLRRISAALSDTANQLDLIEDSVRALIQQYEQDERWSETSNNTPILRLPPEPLPAPVQSVFADALAPSKALKGDLDTLVDWLKTDAEKPEGILDRELARHQQSFFNKASLRIDGLVKLVRHWSESTSAGPEARWILMNHVESYTQWRDSDPELWFSPASAGEGLSQSLWNRCAGAVLCSATLAVNRSFDRFYSALGLDHSSECQIVDGAFDYANQGTIRLPSNAADPSNAHAHDDAILQHVEALAKETKGSLVLFSSKAQMRRVTQALSTEASAKVLSQLELGRNEVIRHHQRRRERAQTSIIFGLQSYAEGIDLPGDLLEEVVITRLPFTQPDDPIHATYAEWVERQGQRSFEAITLPMASIKLRQAVGRLIRSPDDIGVVTFLDQRIRTKGYGARLLADLPPFKRELN